MKNTKLEKAFILETESTRKEPKKTHKKIEIVHTGPTGPRTLRGARARFAVTPPSTGSSQKQF